MKKLLLVLTIVAGTTFSASAQIAQGSILVDTYYGFTNIPGAIYNDAWDLESSYWNGGEATTSGIGPLGIRVEYMTSDKLSVGIDFALNLNSASFTGEDYDYNNMDSTGNFQPISFTAEGSSTKWGAMVTLNYHFVTNDIVDFYLTAGAGYKNRSSTLEQDNPNYTNNAGEPDNVAFEEHNSFFRITSLTPETSIPLAARIGLGLRVFFTDNIGANIGLGFGQGGILNAGLSFAF